MQLVEKTKFKINDPISKHLEGLPENWDKITIKQLLSHISGLPAIEDPNGENLIGGKGQDSAWVKGQKMPLRFEAVEEFNYKAENYLLIQKLIEKYGESAFEKFIEKNQFVLQKWTGQHLATHLTLLKTKAHRTLIIILTKQSGIMLKATSYWK